MNDFSICYLPTCCAALTALTPSCKRWLHATNLQATCSRPKPGREEDEDEERWYTKQHTYNHTNTPTTDTHMHIYTRTMRCINIDEVVITYHDMNTTPTAFQCGIQKRNPMRSRILWSIFSVQSCTFYIVRFLQWRSHVCKATIDYEHNVPLSCKSLWSFAGTQGFANLRLK